MIIEIELEDWRYCAILPISAESIEPIDTRETEGETR